jgi:hypothetical protein
MSALARCSRPASREHHVQSDGAAAVPEPPDDEMSDFYSKVSEVRQKMNDMVDGQHELTRLHEESKTAVQADKTRKIREAMAEQTEKIKKQAKIVKNDLDYLDALNERAMKRPVRTTLVLRFQPCWSCQEYGVCQCSRTYSL